MFLFTMSTAENFASFRDLETGAVVYVDSFDNREFNVRYGTVEATVGVGAIMAESDDVLNARLSELLLRVMHPASSL